MEMINATLLHKRDGFECIELQEPCQQVTVSARQAGETHRAYSKQDCELPGR